MLLPPRETIGAGAKPPNPLRDHAVAAACAVAGLAVYLQTLASTVTGEDSGELIAAAYTLGIPHPTGYPLWCLLAKAAIELVPFGTVAWRVALLSALLAAGTVYVIALIGSRVTRNRFAGAAGALALAFSFEFWEQSVIAEVYTLNALCLALCLFFLIEWRDARRSWCLYVFAVVYGLGLSNHSLMALFGPVFAAFIVIWDAAPIRHVPRYAAMTVLAAAGLLLYLYLPIRSAANPPVDWGNPETWGAFWDVFTRKQYQFIMTDNPRSVGRFLGQLAVFGRVYAEQFTVWLCWLPALGLAAAWKRERTHAALLTALFAMGSIAAIVIPNFDLTRKDIWINTTYWIPAYLIAAVLLSEGAAVLITLSRSRLDRGFMCAATIAASGMLPLFANYAANDKSAYWFVEDYSANILATLDEYAIYIGDGDHAIFPILYRQVVLGERKDVLLANPYGYLRPELYADMPPAMRQSIPAIPSDEDDIRIIAWLLEHTDRPVYFSRKPPSRALAGRELVNAGYLYRVADGRESPAADIWARYAWRTLFPGDTRGDWTAELVLYDHFFARGRHELDRGKEGVGEAQSCFANALLAAAPTASRYNDFGSAFAEHGYWDLAKMYYEYALAIDPEYRIATRNLAKVYMAQGLFEQGFEEVEKLLDGDHVDAEAVKLAARCLSELGRADEATALLERIGGRHE